MTTATGTARYFDLGPTATYRRRRAGWFPGRGGRATDRLGTHRIVMEKTLRPGNSTEVDEYGVQEETDPPPGCRSFLLLNDTDREQPDVYRCVIGGTGALCTCKAGSTGRECKHAAAIRALITAEVLG